MSRVSPPRDYIGREQRAYPMNQPRARRPPSEDSSNRLIEMLRAQGWRGVLLGASVLVEVILLLIALVPQTTWSGLGFPNGPIPNALAPVVAGAFYVLPFLTGALCRGWKLAIVLATLPAWLDLGIFAVAAAGRIGPFYLASESHSMSTVGTLELFAALGALGWLAQSTLRSLQKRRKGGQR